LAEQLNLFGAWCTVVLTCNTTRRHCGTTESDVNDD
jgi:hypothetical protein